MKLQHVLSRSREVAIDLDMHRVDELKKAARFWVGKEAAKFNKTKCIQALTKVFKDRTLAKEVVPNLSDKQKRALGIFARYGPLLSGSVLSVEMEQRGLAEKKDKSSRSYYAPRRDDVIHDLRNKLILLSGGHDYYSSYYGYGYDRSYPDLTLHPAFVDAIEPAEPLSWQPSKPSSNAAPLFARSSAEPALDIWHVAEALRDMGNWKTVKGYALSKGSQNKLRKLVGLPSAVKDDLALPDPESLFYELLREMAFLSVALEPRKVRTEAVRNHFHQPPVVQSWHWLRAWRNIYLWQDGIGVVPDRDNDYNPVRIDPSMLQQTKEMLIWALCRVAHSRLEWLDLEVFLKDFWEVTHDAVSSIYWSGYSWNPDFEMARQKNDFPAGDTRSLAFWLDSGGGFVANAIMVTLATLGLTERGETGDKKKRPCFRLTPLGRHVLGAPELQAPDERASKPFLTVQPNHEILAYLDAADAQHVCTLARFTRRKSTSGPVQTFALSRDSVYAALEDGMKVGEIETFLVEHGKNAVPANVLRELHEWSGKRESLVLRIGVTVAVAADGAKLVGLGSKARVLSDTAAVLPVMSQKKAKHDFPNWSVQDQLAEPPCVWQVDELGALQTSGDDLVTRYRLMHLAERKKDGWLISEKSVTQARKQGFTADQMLVWLTDHHLTYNPPALLTMAIKNWTGRTKAFLGKVHLLQITRAEARDAVLHSKTFASLLAGHIPPDWFLIDDDNIAEVRRLLKQLGFQNEASYRVASMADSHKP